MRKIGFIVEGDTDKYIIAPLASRLLGEGFQVHVVRLGGKAALPSAYTTISALLDEGGFEHVVVVFDADSVDPEEVDWQRERVEASLSQHRFSPEEVSVCPAVPQIEAWLLSQYVEQPDATSSPKDTLTEQTKGMKMSPPVAVQLVAALDIERARHRSPSFKRFADTLAQVADKARSKRLQHDAAHAQSV